MPEHDETTIETRRMTAPEIFDAAVENAREEVHRSPRTLAFSGLAGGFTLGLTGLAVASIRALIGDGGWQQLVSYLLYPIGFIAVIIGRQQLFTENTLYPVILVLDEHKYVGRTLILWGTVYTSNILGALFFAVLATQSGALRPAIADELVKLGLAAAQGTPAHFFWSGIIGGWLIALVAWVVTASRWTIGQLAMVWLLTFVVGVGQFAHCVVTSSEMLSAVVSRALPLSTYLNWLWPATLGNIAGGVLIVSVLNYGQVRAD
jgi:formate/nitrite transporter FocA (FNT family)